MLHERIILLVKYVTDVIAGEIDPIHSSPSTHCLYVGTAKKDHDVLRSLAALVASLPASDNKFFREEFNTEYEDVQLTAFLSSLTKSTNILNDVSYPLLCLGSNQCDLIYSSLIARR